MSPPIRAGRVRRKTSKDRNGCVTCRERRIKCDADKPFCNRCKSSNRNCGGYTLVFRSIHGPRSAQNELAVRKEVDQESLPDPTAISMPVVIWDCFSAENLSWLPLKFFLDHSIPDLFTRRHASLWKQSIASRCIAGSAVYHAATAVGYVHDKYLSTEAQEPKSAFALEHYQQALRRTNVRISDANNGVQEAYQDVVLACLLFICFELLSGHDEQALHHLDGGLRIVHNFESQLKPDATSAAISKTFENLDLQALTFLGSRKPKFSNVTGKVLKGLPYIVCSDSEKNLDDFLINGHKQVQRCCYFMRGEVEIYKYHEYAPPRLQDECTQQLQCLGLWYQRACQFTNAIGLEETGDPNRVIRSLQKLSIALLATTIKLDCCLSPLETSYDKHEGRFYKISELAKEVLDIHSAPLPHKHFTLNCSVVEPLYFTACKCRNPLIRYRAIAQLRQVGQQGVWNGTSMAAVAEVIVGLEEISQTSINRMIGSSSYEIEEKDRIHGVGLEFSKSIRIVKASCYLKSDAAPNGWEVKSFETPI